MNAASLLAQVPWGLFPFVWARHADATIPHGWRVSFSLGSIGLAVAAGVNVFSPFIFGLNAPGPFRYCELSPPGQGGLALQLPATIPVVYGLEPSLRNSPRPGRWR